MSRRWRYPRIRHGRFTEAPWAVTAPQPPALPLRPVRARPRIVPMVRRGRIAWVPRSSVLAPPFAPLVLRRPDGTIPWQRAGAFTAAVAPTAGPVPRPARTAASRSMRLRRGQFVELVWPQIVQQAPPLPPRVTRAVVRLVVRRRAGVVNPPWPAQVPASPPLWMPSFITGDRPRQCPTRQGRFTTCPSSSPVLAGMRRRPSVSQPTRRGRRVERPWPQAVLPPPPLLVPAVRRGRAAPPALRPHGRIWSGWMPLTVSPEPESSAGVMAARDRAGSMAIAASRSGPTMTTSTRRGAEMEGT